MAVPAPDAAILQTTVEIHKNIRVVFGEGKGRILTWFAGFGNVLEGVLSG